MELLELKNVLCFKSSKKCPSSKNVQVRKCPISKISKYSN